jgi:excisionase family DNA binding protein
MNTSKLEKSDITALPVQVFTRKEMAQLGKVSLPTVDNWRKAGKLPFIKIGRSIRFPAAAITALLSGNTTASNAVSQVN